MQGDRDADGIWAARGGSGKELVVLLHGLGANALVFRTVCERVEGGGRRWLAPDFRGHGLSPMRGPYGYGMHAADVAGLVAGEDPSRLVVLGHSFGGAVAALLGSGLFGPPPARVIGVGVKLEWTPEEEAGALARAARPPRIFSTREEAAAAYLKLSGLAGLVAEDSPEARHGVMEVAGGFAPAFDPAAFGAVGPSIEAIIRQCRSPLTLAAGSDDPMTSAAAMQRFVADPVMIAGAGHNVHVEAPEAVASLVG